MRILIISTFFPPLNSIASLRPYSWARYFVSQGHDVTVLTTDKGTLDPAIHKQLPIEGISVVSINQGALFQKARQIQQDREASESGGFVTKIRQSTGVLSACRMPDVSDYWSIKSLKHIKHHGQWDVVISTSGPYSVHSIGYKLKKLQLTRLWVADYRDLWTNHEFYRGLAPFRMIEKYLEQKWLCQADAITTVSRGLKDSLHSILPNKIIKVIYNGFYPTDEVQEPGSNSRFTVLYTGTVYDGKNDAQLLFKALSSLLENNSLDKDRIEVKFLGKYNAELDEQITQMKLNSIVKQHGMVNNATALAEQQNADLVIFFKPAKVTNTGIITGKLFEYMNSGTPILAVGLTSNDEATSLIESTNTGVSVGTDIEAIQSVILKAYNKQLIINQDTAKLNQFTRDNQAERLHDLIKKLKD